MVEAVLMNKALILLSALLLAGCAAAPLPMAYPVSPNMATTFADGAATITWRAEKNQTYTIYYTDSPFGMRAEWKPLPQAAGLPGTGTEITVSDQPGPNSNRRYLLLTGDQKPY